MLVDVESFVTCQFGYDIRYELVGETGTLALGEHDGVQVRAEGGHHGPIPADYRERFGDAYQNELQEWVSGVLRGEVTGPSAWDGYATTAVAEAAVESLTKGGRVAVELVERPGAVCLRPATAWRRCARPWPPRRPSWLASLEPGQRAKASYPFPADDERTTWYYTPTERGGLPLAEMGPVSQRLAHRLVASGLSEGGYNTAATVMGLENVLDAREGWRRGYDGRTVPHRGRDPQLYFVSVFGDPGAGPWGWRVGGHHVALNYTLLQPTAGSRPARCSWGPTRP